MIRKVVLHYFKRFENQEFDLEDSIVLAGPNNSGKSTLLQALAVWNLAIQLWKEQKGAESAPNASPSNQPDLLTLQSAGNATVPSQAEAPSSAGGFSKGSTHEKGKPRPGVRITRKEFTAIPLRELDLLWYDRRTAFRKNEWPPGTKPGTPKMVKIEVAGEDKGRQWSLPLELRYENPETLYAIPAVPDPYSTIAFLDQAVRIVHVPPFSGIGPEETELKREYQDLLIGQGKPGDILRNLLLELYRKDPDGWNALKRDIQEIFGYTILEPSSRAFILCEYIAQPNGSSASSPRFDIASAGSGFHQVLLLLAFFHARPASVLLLDEPDAHQHVFLQKQVYDRLRAVARRRGCQLILATHSEVLLDSTSTSQIVSFFRTPHRLELDFHRDQVREALKRLSSIEVLLAEQQNRVLYTEGPTDLAILREWARVLNHRCLEFLDRPLWHSNMGRDPRESKAHHFALRAIQPDLRGVLLLDGDNRSLPDHDFRADGLRVLAWRRYEIENYLLVPTALDRFLSNMQGELFPEVAITAGMEYLRRELPPAVLEEPLGDHDYLNATAASKVILPRYFAEAGFRISREEYFQIAAAMTIQEINTEITQKLDEIALWLAIP